MARKRPTRATLYDFRDLDLMMHLAEADDVMTTHELADALGFDAEEGGRPVGMRLAYMRAHGMVNRDDKQKTWKLSRGGLRVVQAHELAPTLRVVEQMPDEQMIEVIAMVTSRFQRGDNMLGTMMRREFKYGTGMR